MNKLHLQKLENLVLTSFEQYGRIIMYNPYIKSKKLQPGSEMRIKMNKYHETGHFRQRSFGIPAQDGRLLLGSRTGHQNGQSPCRF